MSKKDKWVTAAELMERIKSDPGLVRNIEAKEARHRARASRLQAELEPEEAPLLEALGKVGFSVNSVWDLLKSTSSYSAAIPVLAGYLATAQHPMLREGIARALTVTEARGIAGRQILDELTAKKDPPGSQVRWALGNALTVASDSRLLNEIQVLVADPSYADVHDLLKESLSKLRRE